MKFDNKSCNKSDHRMFASLELLKKKTPQNGIGRKEFILELVNEFYTTTNIEAQEQVTANLSNFAYDPINFQFLRDASALDLFFQLLALPNERLVHHSVAGLCNICLDPLSRKEITKPENIKTIIEVFQSTSNIEIAINLLTLFHHLVSEDEVLKEQICCARNLQRIHHFRNSAENRLRSLATVFLEDFATVRIDVNV